MNHDATTNTETAFDSGERKDGKRNMSHNMFGKLLHKDLFETNAISVVHIWMDKENRGKSLPIEAVLILFSVDT